MKTMKRIISLLMISVLIFALAACGTDKKNDAGSINLMTWGGDFIPREIIDAFQEKTGIKVNYKEVTSNEEMLSLLETNPNQYDIAISTDYMVDIMRQKGLLEAFDKTKLSNFGNINPVYQSKYYDEENEFSIPYAVSTAFLLVNPEKVAQLGAKPITSFNDIWQTELKNNIVVIDWSVEIMGVALKATGHEFNETDPTIVSEAKDKLLQLRPNIMRFETNTPEDSLISGEAAVGYMYSNQAIKGQKANAALQPVFPIEGMPIYIDSIVMSKQAPNKDNAYQFLNYLLDPEVSAKASVITQFTNANKAATEFLPDEYKNNQMLNLPEDVVKRTSFYMNVDKVQDEYGKIYNEFKMQ